MSNLREKIINANEKGEFLTTVYKLHLQDRDNRDNIVSEIVSLHNEGKVDLVDEFCSLSNNADGAIDFFLTRDIFEKALPMINSPVEKTMGCVLHLVEEAGEDMSAGHILSVFVEFCAANPERIEKALEVVKTSPEKYWGIMAPVIIGGTKIDMDRYLKEAIDFSGSSDLQVRGSAFFAISKVEFSENVDAATFAMESLLAAVEKETEDQVLSNILKAASTICISEQKLIDKSICCMGKALNSGADLTIHAVSEVLMFQGEHLPEAVLDIFQDNLLKLNPENLGTINNIDIIITRLLKRTDPEKGIALLEVLLIKKCSIKSLDSVVHNILSSDNTLLNKLLTRWFLKGDSTLCEGIHKIVNSVHGEDITPEIDVNEITKKDLATLFFIARKTIGYLFNTPVACASIITSLIRQTKDRQTIVALSSLLFDPLLINYSGNTSKFLQSKIDVEKGSTKKALRESLKALDDYLETLRSIPELPELSPSQNQRETSLRRFSRLMADAYKEAMKGSFVEMISHKSVLLYGAASISHILGGDGQSHRMETPMQSHGTSIEVPRVESLDPLGLDITLRIFRNERLR